MKTGFVFLALLISPLLYSQDSLSVEPVLNTFTKFIKVRDFTVNSSTREAYFSMQSMNEEISVIVKLQMKNDEWSDPEIVNFSGEFKDLEPYLSPDGLRLYFVSNRPFSDSIKETKDYDIWYVERKSNNDKWSAAVNLGSPVNTEKDEFYPAVTTSGNLYFTRVNEEKETQDDIFYSEYTNGTYNKPLALGNSINTEGYEFNSYIAPDESFLIFSGYDRKDGLGSGDLYISYNNNGKWAQAQNLTAINSDQMDYCPYLDSENNILYFTSKRNNLSTGDIKSFNQLLEEINSYENGLSRIYKVDFSSYLNMKN